MRAFFRSVVSAALIGASLGGAPAMAADAAFPTHPLTLVNPYAAGGPADVLARALARALEERLKQPVIVENKAGGAATIGTGFVARAKPDGYTLLMGTSAGHVVTPLMQTTPYDGVADFSFIGIVANQPNVLVVNATVGVDSLEGLVALAKKAPGTLNYASAGTGGATHLGAEAFLQKAGLRIIHVPYPGASPALKDLLGGQVQLGMLNLAATLPFIEQGKLRALAYGGPKRATALPQVPTLAEAGYGGTEVSTWYSLAAPKGTPPQAIEVLREAVSAIQATPAWQQFLDNQGAERMSLSPAQTTEFVRRDQAAMTTLLGSLSLLAK